MLSVAKQRYFWFKPDLHQGTILPKFHPTLGLEPMTPGSYCAPETLLTTKPAGTSLISNELHCVMEIWDKHERGPSWSDILAIEHVGFKFDLDRTMHRKFDLMRVSTLKLWIMTEIACPENAI